ncbi:protein OXIDATIVE STRESS 3 LIKE 2-like [Aristolochia californica]|uniref:protein OXIDATIVE STRESS 3 LIKE 2-like n=1 Tax=Aristolochia californica TaxID=171875 RepID=UPI0035E22D4F
MSLVFGSREVAGGPTVAYQGEGASPVAYVGKGQAKLSCLSAYLKPEEGETESQKGGYSLDPSVSGESSSIGVGGENSSDEEEVQSKLNGGLSSLDALEESLPIKRGLSSHFSGKSKSFACFLDITSGTTVKELTKAENPFNKRRRILMACKSGWSKKSLYSPLNSSLPRVSSGEETSVADEEGESGEESREDCSSHQPQLHFPSRSRKLKNFDSPRCFSLTDLRNA